MNGRPLRRFRFHVRRAADPLGPMQPLEIEAYDSFGAVAALPDDVVGWDFARFPGGAYSLPADKKAAA